MNNERTARADVGIVMGSDSDFPAIEATVKMLHYFGIRCDTHVISAHRTPEKASEYAAAAVRRRIKVIIAAAGDIDGDGIPDVLTVNEHNNIKIVHDDLQ